MRIILGAEVPTAVDGETFHTYLHMLSIVLLVYLVRAANRRP